MADKNRELLGVQHPKAYEGLFEILLRRLGINLARCRQRGDLDHKAIERMMNRCACCAESEQCKRILAGKTPQIEGPPGFCVNRKSILFLKSATTDDSDSPSAES